MFSLTLLADPIWEKMEKLIKKRESVKPIIDRKKTSWIEDLFSGKVPNW